MFATKPEAEYSPTQRAVPKKVVNANSGLGFDERGLGGIIRGAETKQGGKLFKVGLEPNKTPFSIKSAKLAPAQKAWGVTLRVVT